MFSSRRTGGSLTSGADRWLVLAGAGLLVLGLVLRLLTDIGRSTATGDTVAPVADSAPVVAAAPIATDSLGLDTLPTPDSGGRRDTAAASLGATAAPREHAEPAPPAAAKVAPEKAPPKPAAARPDAPTAKEAAAARAPMPLPSQPAAPAPSPGGWQVQLGVFGQAANAERLRAQVEAAGYRTDLQSSTSPTGERHRVRAVGLATEAAARAAVDSLQTAIGVRGVVVAPGR